MSQLSLIQSVQNSMVKHAYSLKVPRKAKDSLDFLCEGFHLLTEAFRSGLNCRFIFGTKAGWENPEGRDLFERAQREKVRCFEITSKVLVYLSDTVTPQGIVAVVQKPAPAWPSKPHSLVLGLHQVQDAGNMGTLFRSAEAFGAKGLLLTEGCCDPFNPKVVRASMGSLFRLPFVQGQTWESYMAWSGENGLRSYALSQEASVSVDEASIEAPCALWVGSEGAGLPEGLLSSCAGRIAIPMEGKVESLNVAVAASVALFWARRKARFLDTPQGQ